MKASGSTERISYAVIGAAIEVHRNLGPGLLESTYQRALIHELREREIEVQQQVTVPMLYKGIDVGELRIDLLVERALIVELKSVAALIPLHFAQTITYLRVTKLELALLINFNVFLLRDGIRRVLNTPTTPDLRAP